MLKRNMQKRYKDWWNVSVDPGKKKGRQKANTEGFVTPFYDHQSSPF